MSCLWQFIVMFCLFLVFTVDGGMCVVFTGSVGLRVRCLSERWPEY